MSTIGMVLRVPGITDEMRRVLMALVTDTVSELGMPKMKFTNILKKLEIMGLCKNNRVSKIKIYEVIQEPHKLKSVDYRDTPPEEWTTRSWKHFFCSLYFEKFQNIYVFKKEDWENLKIILMNYKPQELRSLIRNYFSQYRKFSNKPLFQSFFENREKINIRKEKLEGILEV